MVKFVEPEFSFKDSRGSLFQLFSNGWKQINVSYTNKGETRGGHYHIKNKEVFFVISGEFVLSVENMKTGENSTYNVKKNDMFIIEPYLKHTFFYTSNTITVAAYNIGFILPNKLKDVFVN